MWQSLNTPDAVIAIDSSNIYDLFIDKKSIYQGQNSFGQMKIQIDHLEGDWYSFTISDKSKLIPDIRGKIETVSSERIRIFYFKHHQILDEADEYHRTSDLSSYQAIMSHILSEPETY